MSADSSGRVEEAVIHSLRTARPSSAGPLRGRAFAPGGITAEQRTLWREICHTNPALDHPFFSLTYAESVARVHRDVRICVLERQGAIAGFFPFQFATR